MKTQGRLLVVINSALMSVVATVLFWHMDQERRPYDDLRDEQVTQAFLVFAIASCLICLFRGSKGVLFSSGALVGVASVAPALANSAPTIPIAFVFSVVAALTMGFLFAVSGMPILLPILRMFARPRDKE